MAKPRRGTCNACGQPILWVKTVKGNNMAVDVDPHVCAFAVPGPYYQDEKGEMAKAVIVFKNKLGVVVNHDELFTAHRCHFDTCTAKGEWKGKAKRVYPSKYGGGDAW